MKFEVQFLGKNLVVVVAGVFGQQEQFRTEQQGELKENTCVTVGCHKAYWNA